jgi:hypothetical protein
MKTRACNTLFFKLPSTVSYLWTRTHLGTSTFKNDDTLIFAQESSGQVAQAQIVILSESVLTIMLTENKK